MARDDYVGVHGTFGGQNFSRSVVATKTGRTVNLTIQGRWYILQELSGPNKKVVHEVKALIKDVSIIERGIRNGSAP